MQVQVSVLDDERLNAVLDAEGIAHPSPSTSLLSRQDRRRTILKFHREGVGKPGNTAHSLRMIIWLMQARYG